MKNHGGLTSIRSIIITSLTIGIFPIFSFPSARRVSGTRATKNSRDKGSLERDKHRGGKIEGNGDKAEKRDIWKIGLRFSEGEREEEYSRG